MQRVYLTGLQPFGYYGAEVVGLDTREVAAAQSFFLQTVGSTCPSRSRTLSLLVLQEPTYRLALGPVITWTNLVWKAATCPGFEPSLPRLRELALNILARPPKAWNQVKGPFGAAIVSLQRVSWKFTTPFVLEDRMGQEVVLTCTSPAKVLCNLRAAWMHMLALKAARKF